MKPSPSYLDGLNPEQLEAVLHKDGSALVLAGAGSGKTRVLTTRIAHLIGAHGVRSDRILAVTFTNKAAGEMRERVEHILNAEPVGMTMGTFHSFGVRVLRQYGDRIGLRRSFSILDADDSLRLIKRIMAEMDIPKDVADPRDVRHGISTAKNALQLPGTIRRRSEKDSYNTGLRILANVYSAYQAELRAQHGVDFDDLLLLPVQLVSSPEHAVVLKELQRRFDYILVDEYQDTNVAQYQLIKRLAEPHGNLMVVGDDDQSIYGWRGASSENMRSVQADFAPRLIRLERNYRSTATILAAANAVIANNTERIGKELKPTGDEGELLRVVMTPSEWDEGRWIAAVLEDAMANGVSASDCAILYRTNAQSRVLEECLRRRGLKYTLVGGLGFYERKEVRDIMAYVRLLTNPDDRAAFERAVNVPRRGLGEKSVAALLQASNERGTSPLDVALEGDVRGVGARPAKAAAAFATFIEQARERAASEPVDVLIEWLIEASGMKAMYEEEGDEGVDRLENLAALVAGAREFVDELEEAGSDNSSLTIDGDGELSGPLVAFLEQATLVSDADNQDEEREAITLSTLHAAKGLEWPVTVLAGMEEGLFPHSRSVKPRQIEEERRLLYVGMTRARESLILTLASTRRRGRDSAETTPSRFLEEIPVVLRGLERVGHVYDEDSIGHMSRRGSFARAAALAAMEPEDMGDIDPWADSDDEPPARSSARAAYAGTARDIAARPTATQSPPAVSRPAVPTPTIRKGDQVEHASLGRGRVEGVLGSGAQQQVIVRFDSQQAPRIVQAAQLKALLQAPARRA